MTSSSNSKPIALSSDPETPLTLDQRNAIYSALISHGGLRNIEEALKHEFQASGYLDDLRTYTNHLLRTGQATSIAELQAKVLEKVREHGGPNGTARSADSPEKSNGVNGTTTNGTTNGSGSSSNAHKDPEDYNLAIPRSAIVEGARTVRRELEKVADITSEGEDK